MLTLKELAIHVPASIRLFEQYELDYYCRGERTLREACLEKGLAFDAVDAELSALREAPQIVFSFTLEDMSTERLADFINGRYHSNERHILNGVKERIAGLLNDPDCNHRALLEELQNVFGRLSSHLLGHSEREDIALFPLMRRVAAVERNRMLKVSRSDNEEMVSAIHALQNEHAEIVALLDELKVAARRYLVPTDASPEYGELIHELALFEQDMHMHLHIENNILFPRLLALCGVPHNKTQNV
jgi:regulator of cell morphogenesis and NO signaling